MAPVVRKNRIDIVILGRSKDIHLRGNEGAQNGQKPASDESIIVMRLWIGVRDSDSLIFSWYSAGARYICVGLRRKPWTHIFGKGGRVQATWK